MKKTVMLLVLMFCLVNLCGCISFLYPEGIWECEELGLIINNDYDNVSFSHPSEFGIQTINGVTKDIHCNIDVHRDVTVMYPYITKSEYVSGYVSGKGFPILHDSDGDVFLEGHATYTGINEFTVLNELDNKKYTFRKISDSWDEKVELKLAEYKNK